MGKKAKYHAKRTITTYGLHRSASWTIFEIAKSSDVTQYYHIMMAMILSAFTLEAYLNHVGASLIKSWVILKEKLSPKEKLEFLSESLDIPVNFGERPFQTFITIFRFRNKLAHAETEFVEEEGEIIVKEGDPAPRPLTEWEKQINIETGQRFLDDTKEMIKYLNEKTGLKEETLFSPEQLELHIDYTASSD